MSDYDKTSIKALAAIAVGFSDFITLICATIPVIVFAAFVFVSVDFESTREYFAWLGLLFKDLWGIVVPSVIVFGVFGYVMTLILRVSGELLRCLVKIEENTQKTKD